MTAHRQAISIRDVSLDPTAAIRHHDLSVAAGYSVSFGNRISTIGGSR